MSADKTKDPAAVALGKKRGAQLTAEHQRAAAKARTYTLTCDCGKPTCKTCRSREYKRRQRARGK